MCMSCETLKLLNKMVSLFYPPPRCSGPCNEAFSKSGYPWLKLPKPPGLVLEVLGLFLVPSILLEFQTSPFVITKRRCHRFSKVKDKSSVSLARECLMLKLAQHQSKQYFMSSVPRPVPADITSTHKSVPDDGMRRGGITEGGCIYI